MLRIHLDRRQRVPHLPVMHVAVSLAVRRILKISAGRTAPVRHRISVLRYHLRQNSVKEHDVIGPDLLAIRRRYRFLENLPVAPVHPSRLDFIVPAPQHDARMVPQPRDLVDRLLPHAILKFRAARHHVAAEHEFLPHQNPQLVANIVEIVGLVISAAPLAHHVHMRVSCRLQNLPVNLRSHPVRKTVERNHVGALGEHRYSIHDKRKAFPRLRHFPPQFDRAQPGFQRRIRRNVFSRPHHR